MLHPIQNQQVLFLEKEAEKEVITRKPQNYRDPEQEGTEEKKLGWDKKNKDVRNNKTERGYVHFSFLNAKA